MNFGVAIFPQQRIQKIANSYRKRYDPHYRLIDPHITIIEKFELDETQMASLIPKLEEVAKKNSPFTIEFYKVAHFFPTSPTIYLAIKDHQPLIQLHQDLLKVFQSYQPTYDFIPHLTIGQNLSEEELHDVYGHLRLKDFHFTSTIDQFHLMYQLEDSSWATYRSFLLQ
jgi:2'-5' RNA ligase